MSENEIDFRLSSNTLSFNKLCLVGNNIFNGRATFCQLTQGSCPSGRVPPQSIEQSSQYFACKYFSKIG